MHNDITKVHGEGGRVNDRKCGEEKMCIGEEQKEVWGVLKLVSEEGTDGRGSK